MSHSTKRIHKLQIVLALILLLSLFPLSVQAQEPVVYGVFFYSPSCPHCHEVIDNHWPGIQAEFGDQLQVLFIDVSVRQNSEIMGTAIRAMNITSRGVPMLIIGSEVLAGSVDIPQRAPTIIRAGLDNGGIGYPPIPDIDRLFESADLRGSQSVPFSSAGILSDPANLLALIVLVGLVGSLGVAGTVVWRGVHPKKRLRHHRRIPEPAAWAFRVGLVIGIILAGSLVMGSFNDGLTLVLSSVVLLIFVALAINVFTRPSLSHITRWAIPSVILAGLLIAGYLTYVETTLAEATCGAVGNCNTVQQSSYARLAGVPIGLIGVIGYAIMLMVWLFDQYRSQATAAWLLFGMALAGVIFSIYLTFLEPFVIGESCVWCLTSAVVMTMLLWLSLPVEHARSVPNSRSIKANTTQ
jgi:uncharacterized membrane protein